MSVLHQGGEEGAVAGSTSYLYSQNNRLVPLQWFSSLSSYTTLFYYHEEFVWVLGQKNDEGQWHKTSSGRR